MALIKCPECQREVSDKASNCPHCGYPINDNRENYQTIVSAQPQAEKKQNMIIWYITTIVGWLILSVLCCNLVDNKNVESDVLICTVICVLICFIVPKSLIDRFLLSLIAMVTGMVCADCWEELGYGTSFIVYATDLSCIVISVIKRNRPTKWRVLDNIKKKKSIVFLYIGVLFEWIALVQLVGFFIFQTNGYVIHLKEMLIKFGLFTIVASFFLGFAFILDNRKKLSSIWVGLSIIGVGVVIMVSSGIIGSNLENGRIIESIQENMSVESENIESHSKVYPNTHAEIKSIEADSTIIVEKEPNLGTENISLIGQTIHVRGLKVGYNITFDDERNVWVYTDGDDDLSWCGTYDIKKNGDLLVYFGVNDSMPIKMKWGDANLNCFYASTDGWIYFYDDDYKEKIKTKAIKYTRY